MRMIHDSTHRFKQRPFYTPQDLDSECESIVTSFLERRYGKAVFPITTDDLTSLIETEAEDLDQYADLREYGNGVQGLTAFQPDGRPLVKISAALADDRRENRRRTTLTHEFGHVHFHAGLFQRHATGDLFERDDEDAVDRLQICRRDTILDAIPVDWMEWQAGHVCGAVLMPATAVRALIRKRFPVSVDNGLTHDSDMASAMIEEVRDAFRVSTEAANVRLRRLGVLPGAGRGAQLL